MSDYFIYVPLTANTVARAADVNARFQAVSAGFDLLPPPIYIYEDRQTFAVDEGSANNYVANPAIPITAYNTGLHIVLQAANANTGVSTLNVSGLGVKEIIRSDGTPLQAGDIVPGQMLDLTYGGTRFQLAMAFADISPAGIAEKIALAGNITVNGNMSATSLTCNGVTLDALTVYGVSLVESVDAVAARSVLGLGTMATQPALAYAPLISPGLLGTPTAPTAAPGTNTTQLATTAFCSALGGLYLPLGGGTVTGDIIRGQTIIKADGMSMGNGTYYAGTEWPIGGVDKGAIYGPTSTDDAMYFQCTGFAFTSADEATTFATITAQGLSVPDDIYSAAWNGNFTVATKNALYDKIEAAAVVTSNGLALKANLAGGNSFTGAQTFTGAVSVPDEAYGVLWNGSTNVPTKNAIYDKIEAIIAGGGGVVTFNGRSGAVTLIAADVNTAMASGGAFGGPLTVPDDVYAAGWNGSTQVPTKNAVYDKIEAVIAGATGVSSFNTRTGAVTLTVGDVTTAMPAFTGDVTHAAGSTVNVIAANAVTLAQMADVATARLLGRVTAATGDPEALTGTQATTLLDVFTSTLKGLAPASAGGTANFLRADGTWATPPGGAGGAVDSFNGRTGTVVLTSGDVTTALTFTPANAVHTHAAADIVSGTLAASLMPAYTGDVTSAAGATANTIANAAVTYAKMQNTGAGFVVLGKATTGAGAVAEIALGTSQLLGRGSSGNIQGLTIAASLALSATQLSVASVPNALTINNGGAGVASGGTYNGSAAVTLSYNSIGALPLTPREQAVASAATVTPAFTSDAVIVTAQAVGLALANWSGTAVPNHGMSIRIKDNGTSRTISYGANYRAIGVTLPTATVAGKTLYLGVIHNATDNKHDVVAVAQEA